MDNITLSKNQLQAILELVSQIGSNRSPNVSVTSVTPTWERRILDNPNGNDYFNNLTSDGNNNIDKSEDFVTPLDNDANTVNLSSPFGDNQILPKTMETIESNNDSLFWRIENGNNNKLIKRQNGPVAAPLEYSYPYFSNSISTRPLTKSQSLATIECSSLISSPTKDSTIKPLSQQLVSASSISSLIPPRTAPSPNHSLVSFGSSQGEIPVNFRRYARSVTSSLGGLIGAGDSIDWEEKRRKMLKYRAELAAQREEKAKREREEREKARAEEEAAEKRMIAVQRRLKEEYELERRLIEEKRETVEKRRLAVIAAMEQNKTRGNLRKDDHLINYADHVPTRISVSTQTESNINHHHLSNNKFTYGVNKFHVNGPTLDHHTCSSSSQTDISLLFDLIRSLGFSTMTLKGTSDDDENDCDDDGDDHTSEKVTNPLKLKSGLRPTMQRLNKTAKARLKFHLDNNLTKTITTGSNQNKRNFSKSASHTNLTRIDKSRSESNQEKSSNRLKTMSSSSTDLASSEVKPIKLKGIINHKRQSTSNLPLINDNQQNFKRESIVTSNRKKLTKSTLEGIF